MIESAKKALALILQSRMIAVIRDISPQRIIPAAHALAEGGVVCLEVTFDSRSEEKSADTLRSITMLKEEFGDGIALGAGTVLSALHVREAAEAGAVYIISPGADQSVIRETKNLGLVSIPGALTPTEILNAWDWGADVIKLFPASVMGPDYIRAIKSPIRHIPLFAVGGVTPDNVKSFLDAGCDGVSAGGNLVDTKRIDAGDYAAIQGLARAYADACATVYGLSR